MTQHRLPYDKWFDDVPHPHDSMPLATNDRFDMYGSSECDDAYNAYRPKIEIEEEEVTPHEKAYRIATAKYNPFSIGGSENIHDFDKKD
tara:strand:- start:772 stop:1038 length:267 start_codon:yes stop_codon:yes gene_type:complete